MRQVTDISLSLAKIFNRTAAIPCVNVSGTAQSDKIKNRSGPRRHYRNLWEVRGNVNVS